MKKERKEFKSAEELKIKRAGICITKNNSVMPKSSFEYQWPEFKNDKERIKYYSQLAREGQSISKLMLIFL